MGDTVSKPSSSSTNYPNLTETPFLEKLTQETETPVQEFQQDPKSLDSREEIRLFMKCGECREVFIECDKCVEEGEQNNEDIFNKCHDVVAALEECMKAHPDHYEPLLEALEKQQEEEEEMERQLRLFMRSGECGDVFIEYAKCVEEGEQNNEDILNQCHDLRAALVDCMDAHRDHYGPLLEEME